MKSKKVRTAIAVYKDGFNATTEETKALGFKERPSKEFLIDAVLRILAEAYIKEME